MKKLYSYNFITRILFLLLTPTLFRALNFCIYMHSIYWGTITMVVIIWSAAILISHCSDDWVVADLLYGYNSGYSSQRSLFQIKWKKPIIWARILTFVLLHNCIYLFLIRLDSGTIIGIKFEPWFFEYGF